MIERKPSKLERELTKQLREQRDKLHDVKVGKYYMQKRIEELTGEKEALQRKLERTIRRLKQVEGGDYAFR